MSRAASRWVDGARQAEGNSALRTRLEVPNELRLDTLELALEEPVQLLVLRCLLAIRDGERVGGVAWLLDEDLRELDHVGVVVECLGEVDHLITRVLLIAGTSRCEEGCERGDRDWVALVSASSCELKRENHQRSEKSDRADRHTHACSHLAVESAIVCAIRF